MAFSFMPKTTQFFDLFDKQAENLVQGSRLFLSIVNDASFTPEFADKMHAIEHKGDEINHTIVRVLNEVFVTPFDREDIMALAGNMDEIIDGMYMITKRIVLYKITQPTPELKQFAVLMEKSILALQQTITELRHGNKNMAATLKNCVEINRLENEGDTLRDNAIAGLFSNGKDPIEIIKWKEIYEVSERVTDMCEHVANTVESIIVKNN
ncbi:hypothetical protein Dip510_000548 [Elusimicrobium posterum]|uniref:DUF47 domain-containing protein n=1 Tax=Elusimicrobium posterum TaxID=3116653 RepID=UPI003C7167EF